MPDLIAILKLVEGWITKPKTMWVFLLGITGVLTLIGATGHHNIAYLVEHYIYLCLAGGICAAGLAVHGVYDLKAHYRFTKRMNNLSLDEKNILSRFIGEDKVSLEFLKSDGAARRLSDDGLLYAPNIPAYPSTLNMTAVYNILDKTRFYVKKHPVVVQNR